MSKIGYKEYQEIRESIEKDIRDEIVSRIKVNDSYFYGEIVISKSVDMNNPYGETFQLVCVLMLHKSSDFKKDYMSTNQSFTAGKRIVVKEKLELDNMDQATDPNVIMPLFYEILGKSIARELLKELQESYNQFLYNPYVPMRMEIK